MQNNLDISENWFEKKMAFQSQLHNSELQIYKPVCRLKLAAAQIQNVSQLLGQQFPRTACEFIVVCKADHVSSAV